MVGQHIDQMPDAPANVRSLGHLVGNHTWSHPDLVVALEAGRADAADPPIGFVPAPGALNLDGLDVDPGDLATLRSAIGKERCSTSRVAVRATN